jgi:HD-GYP domain-containing protein (c-di-GMP phosphodiesterase class II)
VRHHHEHVDGTGYPEGLVGAAIPIEARVVAAADAYVSIGADRSHATGLDADAALDVLRAAAGTQLDADVVEALVRVIARETVPAERRAAVRHPRAA